MKTYIERTLKQIYEIGDSKNLMLSCDIYFDCYGEHRSEQYVVKIHDPFGINLHFRTNHIRKSLKQALKAVKEL